MNVDARFDSVLHQVVGTVGIAVLNRPAVLNVIDMKLIKALHKQLEAWRRDQAITAVLVRGAGERAFCAGGDVRAVYEHRGDDAFMHEVYHAEYILDDAIARYSKPYIALMSGIMMGGGCGISVHGSHRVVTETTQLAMPECRIGLFPDIGASYFLARCPGELGLYLALTGARIGAADALYLGLADYFVPTERLPENPSCARGGQLSDDGACLPEQFVRRCASLSPPRKDRCSVRPRRRTRHHLRIGIAARGMGAPSAFRHHRRLPLKSRTVIPLDPRGANEDPARLPDHRLSHCSAADAAQRLFRRRSCPHHR